MTIVDRTGMDGGFLFKNILIQVRNQLCWVSIKRCKIFIKTEKKFLGLGKINKKIWEGFLIFLLMMIQCQLK